MVESGNTEVLKTFKRCKTEIKSELTKLKALAQKGDPDDRDKVKDTADKCRDLIKNGEKLIKEIEVSEKDNAVGNLVTLTADLARTFGLSFVAAGTILYTNKQFRSLKPEKSDLGNLIAGGIAGATLVGGAKQFQDSIKSDRDNAERWASHRQKFDGLDRTSAYNKYKHKCFCVFTRLYLKVYNYEDEYKTKCKQKKNNHD
jgi:hypothetical protein